MAFGRKSQILEPFAPGLRLKGSREQSPGHRPGSIDAPVQGSGPASGSALVPQPGRLVRPHVAGGLPPRLDFEDWAP